MKIIKKLGAIVLTGVMLFACGGCGDKPETPKAYNPFDPFWEGETVYNEPVVLVKDDATGEIKGNLLFAPTEIIEVKNYSLETTYDPSEYTVEGSTFKATASSTMPFMTEANLRGEGGEDYGYAPYPGSNIAFTEGVGLVMQQVNVTYKHKGAWGVKPTVQSQDIPNAMAKLKKGEDINLFVFGDSISTGANSSGKLGIAPYLPTYPQGVANQLTAKYGSKVNLYNGSVGGWMSSDGLTNIAAALPTAMNGNIPDLAIVGFGMNDGSLRVPATTYTDNVLRIIGAIREYAPNCDIVLISTILANPESPQNTSFTPQYLAYDRELANTVERVALVDMMTLSQELYKYKRGVDLLANNINHPNDFLTRCYVANIIGTICG